MDRMIVHLIQKWFLVPVHISIQRTGLVGFEPTTAGLKGQCATWLRYRPPSKISMLCNLVFAGLIKS